MVTGASRGIGWAIALRLGRDGANVVVTYHSNRTQAEAVVAEIVAQGVEGLAVQADVSVNDLFIARPDAPALNVAAATAPLPLPTFYLPRFAPR